MASTHLESGVPILQQHPRPGSRPSLKTYEDVIALTSEEGSTLNIADDPVDGRLPRYRGKTSVEIRLRRAVGMAAIISSLRALSYPLLPSFVQTYLNGGYKNSKTKIYPTTYLNGIRGLAAFLVYCQHVSDDFYVWTHRAYLESPEDVHFIQLPIVRLLISGSFMICIFFILSGFVLSYKPVQLIRQNNKSALLDNLASSTFRRAPRLFLPCLPPMLIAGVVAHYGKFYKEGAPLDEATFSPASSLLSQLRAISWAFVQMSNPYTWAAFRPAISPQLWTLCMEFRGSMMVFILLLCLCRIKNMIRIALLCAFIFYSMYLTHWDTSLFVIGILLSEYRCIRERPNSRSFALHLPSIPHFELVKVLFFSALLVLSLHIGSWPGTGASKSPGYRFLCTLTMGPFSQNEQLEQFFWLIVAATTLLITFELFPVIQTPFITRAGIYFGDISFALYIVHWPILYTFGRWVTLGLIKTTGSYNAGFWLGAIITTPIVIWVADLWWRWGDQKSVALAKWLAEKCTVKTGDKS